MQLFSVARTIPHLHAYPSTPPPEAAELPVTVQLFSVPAYAPPPEPAAELPANLQLFSVAPEAAPLVEANPTAVSSAATLRDRLVRAGDYSLSPAPKDIKWPRMKTTQMRSI